MAHSAGTRFILLERDFLEYVTEEEFNLGQSLTFRATSLNGSSQTTITETFTGKSQVELAPSQLKAKRVAGNIEISWSGSGRIGGRGRWRMGQYFTGYRVEVNGSISTTTNQALTVVDPSGSITIRVNQTNSITGEGPAVELTL